MATGSTHSQYSLYSHVVPNSHMWISLEGLKVSVDQDVAYHATTEERQERIKKSKYSICDCYEPLTFEYIIIGLRNAIREGYIIKKVRTSSWTFPPDLLNLQFLIDMLETEGVSMQNLQIALTNYIQYGYEMKKHKIKTKMKRKKIYKRIDTERQYQDLQWSTRRTLDGTPDDQKPPAEWLSYMQHHINDANKGVYDLDTEEALAQIRKVVALGVRCLELYGCPERKMPPDLLELHGLKE